MRVDVFFCCNSFIQFERALGLSVLNTVGVRGITRDMAMNEQSSSRRKRLYRRRNDS